MKKDGLIFANARAKSKENNLLSEERLHRILESKTTEDAMRVLSEIGYGGGISVERGDFYTLLKEEEKIATAFVLEAAPKGVGFECFFAGNDYHNLKALCKQKYGKLSDISEMLVADGNIPFAELKQRFDEGKINNPYMSEALKKIDKAFEAGNGSPRLIDIESDKAMYAEIRSRFSSCDKVISKYFTVKIDLINIESFLRCEKIQAGTRFFAESFVEGGSLDWKRFSECGQDKAKFEKMLASTPYKSLWDKADGDFSVLETARDDALLKIVSVNKADMFSVGPILGYYLAKLNEVRILRVALVAIKNKIPYEEMKKRVRALYA